MNVISREGLQHVIIAGLILTLTGCQREGINVQVPPLASLRQVPIQVVMEPTSVTRRDFMLQAATNRYRSVPQLYGLPWINSERCDELFIEYLSDASLFQAVHAQLPLEKPETFLVLRPRVTFGQYVRPSIRGTMLTLGTGLIYNILGVEGLTVIGSSGEDQVLLGLERLDGELG